MEYYMRSPRTMYECQEVYKSTIGGYGKGSVYFWVSIPSGRPTYQYLGHFPTWSLTEELKDLDVSERCKQSEWEF